MLIEDLAAAKTHYDKAFSRLQSSVTTMQTKLKASRPEDSEQETKRSALSELSEVIEHSVSSMKRDHDTGHSSSLGEILKYIENPQQAPGTDSSASEALAQPVMMGILNEATKLLNSWKSFTDYVTKTLAA